MLPKVQEPENAILSALFDQLKMGWLYYSCAKALDDAYGTRKIVSAFYFFRGAYVACVNEALLSLAKLSIANPKSVTIYTLIKYAEENPAKSKFANSEDVQKACKMNRNKLRKYKALLKNLENQRNNLLAHFGKINIEDPSWAQSDYIDMSLVESCYRELLNILNSYYDFYEHGEYRISNIDEGVEEDVKFLMSRIGKLSKVSPSF